MFCSSRANHTSTNFKMFLSWKLDKFTSFSHSVLGWILENLYKNAVTIFFRWSWHFKPEKLFFFGNHLYCKTRTDYIYIKLRVQDFANGKSFSFNRYLKQRFFIFSRESYFVKAIENFVSGLHNCQEFSQPLECLYQATKHRKKVFQLLEYCFF